MKNELVELQQIIDRADQAYYRGSGQIMDDAKYDRLKAKLKELNPEDERLTRVGLQYDPNELRTKTKHTIPMGSLDNIEGGIVGYNKWHQEICKKLEISNTDILASLKMDGSSIRARYEKGKLIEVVTRGNGEMGENITSNAAMFKHLPTILPYPVDVDVRGEAMLFNEDFRRICERDFDKPFEEIPESELSNPRAIGNGLLTRDNGIDSDKIRFIAFNVVFYGDTCDFKVITELTKMQLLEGLGFQAVPHVLCVEPEEVHKFFNHTIGGRQTLPFWIDGVVITLNDFEYQNRFITDDIKSQMRPKYSRAIKPSSTFITTVLQGVKLSVGHTGAIIPTATLKEVRVGGVNVTSALLNNWDEIERLDIAIGDKISVFLAGEIIPKIEAVVEKSPDRIKITEPTRCPSCGEPAIRYFRGKRGAITYCSLPEHCPEAQFGKIKHWVGTSKKGVGILDIGDNILRAIIDNNLASDPADLYTLTVEQLENLKLESGVRVGNSRATKIVKNIADKKNLSLHVFLGSLGIDLLGRRRVQLLQKAAGGALDRLENWLDLDRLRSLDIEGFGDITKEAIVAGISESSGLIQKLLDVGVTVGVPVMSEKNCVVAGTMVDGPNGPKPIEELKKGDLIYDDSGVAQVFETHTYAPLDGVSCCWTGTRDYTTEFEALGGTVKSGVSKGLHLLVQKDPMSVSNKTKKAESYGTRIIGIDYLKRIIDGEVKVKIVDGKAEFV